MAIERTMNKFMKTTIIAILLAGSALTTTQSTSANGDNETDITKQTEVTNYSNILSYENGKDGIKSPAPGKISLMVYANFEKSGEFILYNTKVVSLYTKPNGTVSGAIAPQVLHSKKRQGQWFLIDTYLGERWVYTTEDVVDLRDLDEKNAKLYLQESVNIYTLPFLKFNTDEKIAPSAVNVLKQAGNWFLVEYNSRKVWITTEKAKYEGAIGTINTSTIYGVPYKKMIIPTGNKSVRPGFPLKPGYITVHNTANTASGANADMHAKYLLNLAANNNKAWVSWHFTVDDKQIIQHLPLDEAAFHAGDNEGPGNRSSIGIEIAENADGNYAKAEENAKKLIAYLVDELNVPMEKVKGHREWSGKYCPRVILNNGWTQFMTSLQKVYDTEHKNNAPKPSLYRIITEGFLGEKNVKRELDTLRAETGWWATYESLNQTEPYYRIKTGEYLGENNVKAAMTAVNSKSGMWMTYEKTRPAYSIYHIETGGFYGKENVERALEGLKRDTGWWATYEVTNMPNMYRILTGGFAGEAAVKEALERVKARNWWATYKISGEPVYYYRIITGGFLGENSVKQSLAYFTNSGWWAAFEPTGKVEGYYRILTGGFGSLEVAEQQAQWLRDTRNWKVTTQEFK